MTLKIAGENGGENGNGGGLLNMEQAGEYLGLRVSNIYRLTMRRKIPFVKFGRLNRFKRQDLDKFIEQNEIGRGDFND